MSEPLTDQELAYVQAVDNEADVDIRVSLGFMGSSTGRSTFRVYRNNGDVTGNEEWRVRHGMRGLTGETPTIIYGASCNAKK